MSLKESTGENVVCEIEGFFKAFVGVYFHKFAKIKHWETIYSLFCKPKLSFKEGPMVLLQHGNIILELGLSNLFFHVIWFFQAWKSSVQLLLDLSTKSTRWWSAECPRVWRSCFVESFQVHCVEKLLSLYSTVFKQT